MSNALALRAGNLLDHGEKASCTASRATGRVRRGWSSQARRGPVRCNIATRMVFLALQRDGPLAPEPAYVSNVT